MTLDAPLTGRALAEEAKRRTAAVAAGLRPSATWEEIRAAVPPNSVAGVAAAVHAQGGAGGAVTVHKPHAEGTSTNPAARLVAPPAAAAPQGGVRGVLGPRDILYRSRTEARYAAHLETLRVAGHIARWDYEPEKWRLAAGAHYTPDFRIVYPNGTVEFVDVKGRKGERWHATETARVKLRLAAELHPYPLFVVWPLAGNAVQGVFGGWGRERIGGAAVAARPAVTVRSDDT